TLDVKGRGFALEAGVGGEDDLAHAVRGDAAHEVSHREVVGADAVERRQPAAEHVIDAPVFAGALDGADVGRLLHHADQSRVAPRVAADGADLVFGEI